jgi:hypothetical protein
MVELQAEPVRMWRVYGARIGMVNEHRDHEQNDAAIVSRPDDPLGYSGGYRT